MPVDNPIPDMPEDNPKLAELINALEQEKDSDMVMITKTKKKGFQGHVKFPRSSRYRGVSKNG